MEDSQIVSLLWARSERAIAALAEKYEKLIFRVAGNILENREDAAECVNDTYLGVWNSVPPQRPNPLTAFVCRIARNVSLNKYRSNRAQKRDSTYDLPLSELEGCLPGPSVEEVWSAQELGRILDRFLDTLDRENRVIFLQRYWFSDSVSAIAARRGMSANHVSVRLSRMRGQLRQYLIQEGVRV